MNTGEERLYDLSMIEDMAMGDEAFMKELAETFISSVPPVVESMVEACKNKDWKTMGDEAHSLKSNIETLQIASIKADIRTIEANGKYQIELEETPAIVEKVAAVLTKAMQQIKEQYHL
ncbi:Hpt domain-containing protein [Parasediminibacterium sp. JCM 36343]|uniref:Hpt domain-containing protein n=1 Tax=Parasediminibacterium sp. JCM 36343 TaxID=3374279 RepID=UPI00397AB76D